MDRTVTPGLEVAPSTSPQVAAQPDENKYYIGSERWNRPDSDQSSHSAFIQPNQSNDRSQVKSQSLIKIIGVLIIIVVLLLAVALGVGLGIGLSAQHKQKSSNDDSIASADANNASVTIVETSNAPVFTQNVGNIATTTRTTATQSGQVTMITPKPDMLPFRGCPETNGSMYTATKEISQEDASQIHHSFLKFEILCDTEYVEGGSVMDLQLVANVSTLNECLDLCAIYDFQMRKENFPAHACTGASWAHDNEVAVSPREVLLGFTGKDYTIVAASKAAMRGATILKASDDKTKQLNKHTLMAFSGEAGDTVQFAEFIQANIQLYSMRHDTDLGPSAVASFVRGELARSLRSRKPYTVNLLLGGMDPITKEPHLYWLDYLASLAPLPYAAHGYAQYYCLSILDKHHHPDIDFEQGLKILRMCTDELKRRLPIDFKGMLVKVIDKDGIREIDYDTSKEVLPA